MQRNAFVPVGAFAARTSGRNGALARYRPRYVARPSRQIVRASVPVEANADSFQEQVLDASQDLPVLVDFFAEWCGPCKLVAPLMVWAATEYEGKLKVVKVDTENAPNLIKNYKINGLPTLAVFKKGEAYAVTEGAVGKKSLIKYIDDNVFSE